MKRTSKLLGLIAVIALVATACGDSTDDTTTAPAATSATTEAPAALPGEGITINMGRADWSSGYFQAYIYQQVLEELGYDVTDPSTTELGPSLAYLGMAQGDFDFWVNSWYPGHSSWWEPELPDGTTVGDHLEIAGTVFDGGGIQGWLVTKSFADEYGFTTMEQFNANADAVAAYDAADPVPGNGMADIYGCQESYTCDNIIQNQIVFGGWDNIQQVIAGYDPMFAEAEAKVADGDPIIIYTWTPSTYVSRLIPGQNVYWLGAETVLDDSNPTGQDGGADHSQVVGPTGIDSYVGIPVEQCPAAGTITIDDAARADDDGGLCPMGWVPATITPTVNKAVYEANPAFAALLDNLALPVLDASLASVDADAQGGTEEVYSRLAAEWIAANRARVDAALAIALAAG